MSWSSWWRKNNKWDKWKKFKKMSSLLSKYSESDVRRFLCSLSEEKNELNWTRTNEYEKKMIIVSGQMLMDKCVDWWETWTQSKSKENIKKWSINMQTCWIDRFLSFFLLSTWNSAFIECQLMRSYRDSFFNALIYHLWLAARNCEGVRRRIYICIYISMYMYIDRCGCVCRGLYVWI